MLENQALEPRILGHLERVKGFEPSTPTLARLCSTPELHPQLTSVIAWSEKTYKINLGSFNLVTVTGFYNVNNSVTDCLLGFLLKIGMHWNGQYCLC